MTVQEAVMQLMHMPPDALLVVRIGSKERAAYDISPGDGEYGEIGEVVISGT